VTAVGTSVALRARGLTKAFFGVRVLDNVDFELHGGEVHALVGQNGSGKSTLAKILSGVYRKSDGAIEIAGEPVEITSARDAIALGIALIPQDPNLVPKMNAVDNVFLGKEIIRTGQLDRAEMRRVATRTFERLGMVPNLDVPVAELGVSVQEMVAIARALLLSARIFIFDEPTASLSSHEIESLFRVIRTLKADGAAVIFISHRLEEVFDLADKVTVLRDGCIVATGDVGDFERDAIVRSMVGAEAATIEHGTATLRHGEPGDVLIAAEDVTFGNRVRDVSFEVRAGEVVGILGQVGAGKSELVRHVVGAQRGSTGRVSVRGVPTRIRNPRDASRAGIGFLPEDRLEGLVPLMGVADNILLADLGSVCGAMGTIDRGSARGVAERLVDELQIAFKTHLSEPVRYLSGGNQQKTLIARWLHRDSLVLIFDEPTKGIDVVARARVHHIIRRLAEAGKGVLIVTSECQEALAVCDRILVMRGGTITAEFDARGATEERLVEMAV